MEILGVGPGEMLLILVIALVVFGPGRLPEIGAALGRAIGDFRRASSEFTADLQGSVEEARSGLEETLSSTQVELSDAAEAVQREARAISKEVKAKPATTRKTTAVGKQQEAEADDPDTRWLRLGYASEDDQEGA
jgi:TatA/E family protein of Tat protein translocase